MKNFETNYSVDGTSALQPKFERKLSSADNIIEFPGQHPFCGTARASFSGELGTERSIRSSVRTRIRRSELVQSLHNGSTQGCAYNRISPWQAAAAGIVFSACALVSILLGL